jgi:hypothetical protein
MGNFILLLWEEKFTETLNSHRLSILSLDNTLSIFRHNYYSSTQQRQMRAKTPMIALQNASTTPQHNFNQQPYAGILSERSAILLCGLGVALFAIPILVALQGLSGFYWGGVSIYQLLSGSELGKMDDI